MSVTLPDLEAALASVRRKFCMHYTNWQNARENSWTALHHRTQAAIYDNALVSARSLAKLGRAQEAYEHLRRFG